MEIILRWIHVFNFICPLLLTLPCNLNFWLFLALQNQTFLPFSVNITFCHSKCLTILYEHLAYDMWRTLPWEVYAVSKNNNAAFWKENVWTVNLQLHWVPCRLMAFLLDRSSNFFFLCDVTYWLSIPSSCLLCLQYKRAFCTCVSTLPTISWDLCGHFYMNLDYRGGMPSKWRQQHTSYFYGMEYYISVGRYLQSLTSNTQL